MSCKSIDPRSLKIELNSRPEWWENIATDQCVNSSSEMIDLALRASAANLTTENSDKKGGPFGAAVFVPKTVLINDKAVSFSEIKINNAQESFTFNDVKQWALFSLGSNLVLDVGRCELHAEVVAGQFAAQRLIDMGADHTYDFWKHWLVVACTSAPCDMCLNYFTWCSPRAVIAGTTIYDTMSILSFHEGRVPGEKIAAPISPLDEPWAKKLQARGIHVEAGVARQKVIDQLFNRYSGPIYNSGPAL
jgi:tRNA(Arg) A34 adenosine deaminase TadA